MRRYSKIVRVMVSLYLIIGFSINTMAAADTKFNALSLTVEELRIAELKQTHPNIADRYKTIISDTKTALGSSKDFVAISQATTLGGSALWEAAKRTVAIEKILDDRSLYWSRLMLTAFLRTHQFSLPLSSAQRSKLVEILEHVSRGRDSIKFSSEPTKKILLTGFDPFLLDKNIDQSNPSGIVALKLDGKTLKYRRSSAEIQTVIFPVRFEDFDAGELESLLEPLIESNQVDMIVTVSMGRTDFDLEHFPGRRRSSGAPDNLNIYSGGNEKEPKIPRLDNAEIEGPEFVEFSLPYRAMRQVMIDAQQDANEEEGRFIFPYLINDNRTVTTLDGTIRAKSLTELKDSIAVRGSGGGYLSNEISYRSVLLARKYQPLIPTGHIHTPRIERYDARKLKTISDQVTEMLRYSIIEI